MKELVSFVVGLVFALGLGISGMTQTSVVKGFLDVTGDWNPALMGVMIGAIGVHALAFRFIKRRRSPLLDAQFYLPTRKDIDLRLVAGAVLFGIGWGLVGICPGPGLVSLVGFQTPIVVFIVSMLLAMAWFKWLEKRGVL